MTASSPGSASMRVCNPSKSKTPPPRTTAEQDHVGGERVRALRDHVRRRRCFHRPGTDDAQPGGQDLFQQRLQPVEIRPSSSRSSCLCAKTTSIDRSGRDTRADAPVVLPWQAPHAFASLASSRGGGERVGPLLRQPEHPRRAARAARGVAGRPRQSGPVPCPMTKGGGTRW